MHGATIKKKTDNFCLLTVNCRPTVHIERIVAFPLQQWLQRSATILRYSTWPILFVCGLLSYPASNSDRICRIMNQDAVGSAGGSSSGTRQRLPPVEVARFGVDGNAVLFSAEVKTFG